jgi:hypothetical protein
MSEREAKHIALRKIKNYYNNRVETSTPIKKSVSLEDLSSELEELTLIESKDFTVLKKHLSFSDSLYKMNDTMNLLLKAVPKFSGEINEFSQFFDVVESIIENVKDGEKLTLLEFVRKALFTSLAYLVTKDVKFTDFETFKSDIQNSDFHKKFK